MNSMRSESSREDFNLQRDLRATPQDGAVREHRREEDRVSLSAYLEFLSRFPAPSNQALAARKGPRGAPFSFLERRV